MENATTQNFPQGTAYEKFWAGLEELRIMMKEMQKETDRRWIMEDERRRSEDEHRKVEDGKRRAEIARQTEEINRQTAQYKRETAELDRKMGYLSNRFGEVAEHLVSPRIMEKFNELGFNFTEMSENKEIRDPGSSNVCAEIDLLLENGDIVIAVEVKVKPKQADIDDCVRKMEILRKKADKRNDTRKFRGALAGVVMKTPIRQYIFKKGLYLIEPSGDTVKITIPDNFKPREW